MLERGTGIVSIRTTLIGHARMRSSNDTLRRDFPWGTHARLALLQYLQLSEPIVSFGTTTAMGFDFDRLVGATGGSGASRVVISSAPKSLALLLLTLPNCGAWRWNVDTRRYGEQSQMYVHPMSSRTAGHSVAWVTSGATTEATQSKPEAANQPWRAPRWTGSCSGSGSGSAW